MRFGAHHEWGRLREVVIGISPAEDFVVFHEESMRWQVPAEAELTLEFRDTHAEMLDVLEGKLMEQIAQGRGGAVRLEAERTTRIEPTAMSRWKPAVTEPTFTLLTLKTVASNFTTSTASARPVLPAGFAVSMFTGTLTLPPA